jgi:hypothetical protein
VAAAHDPAVGQVEAGGRFGTFVPVAGRLLTLIRRRNGELIELRFRDLKTTLGMDVLRGRTS